MSEKKTYTGEPVSGFVRIAEKEMLIGDVRINDDLYLTDVLCDYEANGISKIRIIIEELK